jgi:hypothetical protein
VSSIFKVCEINTFIGVDVGKFFVDMYCSFGRKYYTSVSNDRVTLKKTLNKILKAMSSYGITVNSVLVSMESTGGCENSVRDILFIRE